MPDTNDITNVYSLLSTLENTLRETMMKIDDHEYKIESQEQTINNLIYLNEKTASLLFNFITYESFKEAVVNSNLPFSSESISVVCNAVMDIRSTAYYSNRYSTIGYSLINWSVKLINTEASRDMMINMISDVYNTIEKSNYINLYDYTIDEDVCDIIRTIPLEVMYDYINTVGICTNYFLIHLKPTQIYDLVQMSSDACNFNVLSKLIQNIYTYNNTYTDYIDTANLLYNIVIDKNHSLSNELIDNSTSLNIIKKISPRIDNYYKLLNK